MTDWWSSVLELILLLHTQSSAAQCDMSQELSGKKRGSAFERSLPKSWFRLSPFCTCVTQDVLELIHVFPSPRGVFHKRAQSGRDAITHSTWDELFFPTPPSALISRESLQNTFLLRAFPVRSRGTLKYPFNIALQLGKASSARLLRLVHQEHWGPWFVMIS